MPSRNRALSTEYSSSMVLEEHILWDIQQQLSSLKGYESLHRANNILQPCHTLLSLSQKSKAAELSSKLQAMDG